MCKFKYLRNKISGIHLIVLFELVLIGTAFFTYSPFALFFLIIHAIILTLLIWINKNLIIICYLIISFVFFPIRGTISAIADYNSGNPTFLDWRNKRYDYNNYYNEEWNVTVKVTTFDDFILEGTEFFFHNTLTKILIEIQGNPKSRDKYKNQ